MAAFGGRGGGLGILAAFKDSLKLLPISPNISPSGNERSSTSILVNGESIRFWIRPKSAGTGRDNMPGDGVPVAYKTPTTPPSPPVLPCYENIEKNNIKNGGAYCE